MTNAGSGYSVLKCKCSHCFIYKFSLYEVEVHANNYKYN